MLMAPSSLKKPVAKGSLVRSSWSRSLRNFFDMRVLQWCVGSFLRDLSLKVPPLESTRTVYVYIYIYISQDICLKCYLQIT